MPMCHDLGQVAANAVVTVPFASIYPWGGLQTWSGLAMLVRPGGEATEAGIASDLNNPVDGRHKFIIDLARAATLLDDGWLIPGRYFVVVYGDPLEVDEDIQGLFIATFTIPAMG